MGSTLVSVWASRERNLPARRNYTDCQRRWARQ